jgi:hypothetical protein
MKTLTTFLLALAVLGTPVAARADVKSTAAREAAEYVMKKFGKEAVQEGTEVLARRIEVMAVKHGDDVIKAVKQVGPQALKLVDDAGAQGATAARLLAKHGDEAALWVLARPRGLTLVGKYGDEAAEVLIKHKGVAEPVLEQFGASATQALKAVSAQNGRRLAMMASKDGGELATITAKLGREPAEQLVGVVGRYGDRAMDFIWRHKGVITMGAVLTAFLANPEPFLDGTKDLAGILAENTLLPVSRAVAGNVDWTLVVLCLLGFAGVLVLLRLRRRRLATARAMTA